MNIKTIILNVIITFLFFTVFYFLMEKRQDKLAYVKFGVLYEDFELKKNLENKLKNIQAKRKAVIDSLEFELTLLQNKLQSKVKVGNDLIDSYEGKNEHYFQKKEQFKEDNEAMISQYNEQIIKKINESVKNYGNIHGYTFIFGADGSANLMHALDTKDVTADVLKYLNSIYNGKND